MSVDLAPHENPRIDALPDAGRLRWVLEFIQRDLDAETSEVLGALGDDLVHAAAPWWAYQRRCPTMPATQVRALQEEIRQGVHAFLSESMDFVDTVLIHHGHKRPQGGWVLPTAVTHLVRVRLDRAGRYLQAWHVCEGTDERTAIIEGVARLIKKFDERLCTCPVCETPFLRQYRQAYCTVRCSNKVRNRRRLDRQSHQQKTGRLVTTPN